LTSPQNIGLFVIPSIIAQSTIPGGRGRGWLINRTGGGYDPRNVKTGTSYYDQDQQGGEYLDRDISGHCALLNGNLME